MPVDSHPAASSALPSPDPTPGYRLEDQIGHLIRRAHQRHAAIFQDGFAETELTPTQFAALVKIKDLGQVTQNLLGRLTAMDPATIQGVVQRLHLRELVERRDDPADRRTTILSLSPAGRALCVRAIEHAREVTRATLDPLTADERQALIELLRKLT